MCPRRFWHLPVYTKMKLLTKNLEIKRMEDIKNENNSLEYAAKMD